MRLTLLFLALLGQLAAQETENDCPHKKPATLLPSFTVTPTATGSTSNPGTTTHSTTKKHRTTTSQKPTTATHTTSHESTTATHSTSHKPTTATHSTSHKPTTSHTHPTTSHGNATIHPTTHNSTDTSSGFTTSSPHPSPPPPSPSPGPGSKEAIGDYLWMNESQPCVRLQAQIQFRILYHTQGGKTWGVSVLNPNKTKAQGACEGIHPRLFLSFPHGQLSFGFKQESLQNAAYLNYMAVEYNVSFPQATQWMFSVQNLSLQELQAPLGHSFSCGNATITLTPTFHVDLLYVKLQAAELSPTGNFGPSFSCPGDHSIWLPLIIGLILLGLLMLVLVTFCIVQRRPPTYQPL